QINEHQPVHHCAVFTGQPTAALLQIALEVKAAVGLHSGSIEDLINLVPQVQASSIGTGFAIHYPLGKQFRLALSLHKKPSRTLEFVVREAQSMSSAIPTSDRFAANVRQHATFACVHAVLEQRPADYVVADDLSEFTIEAISLYLVNHYRIAARVNHPQGRALYILLSASWMPSVGAVVGNAQKGTTK